MRQGLFIMLPVVLLLVSCGKQAEPAPGESTGEAAPAAVMHRLSIVDVMEDAVNYVGETVAVTGTVEHVCRHGGKKMFIVGDDPSDRLRVTVGETVAAFQVDLEGSKVVVQGPLMAEKVDDAFLDAWEADLKKPGEDGGPGQGAEAGNHHDDIPAQIATFRMIIADNDGEPLNFYHLECMSFEEIDI